MMSPPLVEHQEISMNIFLQFSAYFKGKTCKPYYAPIGVRLCKAGKEKILQPDLLVLCDTSKIEKRYINGAPDLVVEIVSESSKKDDKVLKMMIYKEAGVKEYWVVDGNRIIRFWFEKDETTMLIDTVESRIFEGLVVDVSNEV